MNQYFEFIRYAMNPNSQSIPNTKELDWVRLYHFASEQAIVGVLFEGIKQLGEQGIKPPYNMLMNWLASAEQIAGQNKLINKKCIDVQKELRDFGFENCIIKGQGNAVNYPNPFSRTSGDIDIIIRDADRKKIAQWVREHKGLTGCHFQHAEYEDDGIGVELHFVPCYMNNFIYHRRLQKWFKIQAEKDDIWSHYVEMPDGMGCIIVPSLTYNLIYQLAHMMHHFFDEGIGLRQMMDYYYVLIENGKFLNEPSGKAERKVENYKEILRYLGLWKFAGAVMYVMKEVFAMDVKYMIAPVDELRGKTLMAEILKGGNFGRHSGLTKHSAGRKYIAKTWRNLKHVHEYPAEALCEPFFRTWHFFWRVCQKR